MGERYMCMSVPVSHPPPPKDLLAHVESSWEEIHNRVSMDTLAEKKRVFFHQGVNGSGDIMGVSGGGNLLGTGGIPSPTSRPNEVWDEEAERLDEDEIFHALNELSPEERAKVFLIHDKTWVAKILQLRSALQQVGGSKGSFEHVVIKTPRICSG